jgi:signal transduction histidine kinase
MGIAMQLKDSKAEIIENFEEVKSIKYPRSYLESIMLNLITNAIKYKSSKRSPVIHVNTKRVGDFVKLTVSDNGIGIDLDKHGAQLFQLFKRFNHKVEGRGLGLNIVKSQVESLGGKIEVESIPKQGTKFNVYLKDFKEETK